MDFCDNNDPWAYVDRTREVLDFVSMGIGAIGSFENDSINAKQCNGLMWILLACSETLEKAEKEAKEEAKTNVCWYAPTCEKKATIAAPSAASNREDNAIG